MCGGISLCKENAGLIIANPTEITISSRTFHSISTPTAAQARQRPAHQLITRQHWHATGTQTHLVNPDSTIKTPIKQQQSFKNWLTRAQFWHFVNTHLSHLSFLNHFWMTDVNYRKKANRRISLLLHSYENASLASRCLPAHLRLWNNLLHMFPWQEKWCTQSCHMTSSCACWISHKSLSTLGCGPQHQSAG